jgi:hypothetical protein
VYAGMLTCLDRDHRIAYVLGEIFDLPHAEAAEMCDVSPEVFRQRVSRARRGLEAFTRGYCGLVNPDAPCLCGKRVAKAEALGRLSRQRPALVAMPTEALDASVQRIERLHDTAALLRAHPRYAAPPGLRDRLRAALGEAAGGAPGAS